MIIVLIIAALWVLGVLFALSLGWAAKCGDRQYVVDEPHDTDRTRP